MRQAKLDDLKVGLVIGLDSGFSCHEGSKAIIQQDSRGFYFECSKGKHYLYGQLNDENELVGCYVSG